MPKTARPTALIAVLVSVCAALACLLGAGCGREKADTVAIVNQTPITQSDLCEAMEQAENGELARQMLDSLITRQLIREEAQKREVELSREEVVARLDALKDYILAGTGKDFEAWLADTGQTEEDMLSKLSDQMLTARLVLTEEAVKKYFEANKKRLEELPHNSEAVIFREIVVASEEEAQAVRNELLAGSADGKITGEKFAAVAGERTLDHVGRRRGGMAGWVVKGKSSNPEVEKVLFELEAGEVSEPIQEQPRAGSEGEAPEAQPYWYVLMVEKHLPGGELTLERNRDFIEEWMLGEPRYQIELSQFINNLKAKADIQVVSARYRALDEAYREGREARQRRLAEPAEVAPIVPALPEGVEPPAAEAPPAQEGE